MICSQQKEIAEMPIFERGNCTRHKKVNTSSYTKKYFLIQPKTLYAVKRLVKEWEKFHNTELSY